MPLSLPVEDVAGAAELEALAQAEALLPFDLARGPLLRARLARLTDGGARLLLTLHHIVGDGWSMRVLFRDWLQAWRSDAALPALALQYSDFAAWQRERAAAPERVTQLTYWRSRLTGRLDGFVLPGDRPRPAIQTYRGAVLSCAIAPTQQRRLRALAQREGVTPFTVLLAGFKALLSRQVRDADVVVGSVVANRDRPEFETLIGFIVNVVVLRTDLGGDPRFDELLQRVHRTVLEAYAHHELPFEALVEALRPRRDPSRTPLFQIAFDMRDPELTRCDEPGLRWAVMEPELGAAQYDLHLTLEEAPEGGWTMLWQFNTDLFDATSVQRLALQYLQLLDSALTEPGTRLAALRLAGAGEARRLVNDWSGRAVAAQGAGDTLHGLVQASAGRTPHAPALQAGGTTLDYSTLESRAEHLAAVLRSRGVGPGQRVALCAARSAAQVVALLGILKAGAAYLPLDPTYPSQRLHFMLEDSGASWLLHDSALSPALAAAATPRLAIDELMRGAASTDAYPVPQRTDASPEDVAYVIYTSGSTGLPKGVQIEHRSACNLALAQSTAFGIGLGTRVLQFAAFGFDASVSEIFTTLVRGGTLVLTPPDGALAGAPLLALLSEQAVAVATLPPSLLRALPDAELPALHTLVSAGEACDAGTVQRWGRGRRFVNAYGPTEAAVCTTLGDCDPADSRPPSIGRPLPGMRVYLLDAALQPVPPGVVGDLWIGGAGVARGYLGRDALNRGRFRADPFALPSTPEHSARMYRSGDLARWRDDGRLDYVGREDEQLKLRGYRIELGEIEVALRSHPLVADAVVQPRPDSSGEDRLVAYLVPRSATGSRGGDGALELWPSVAEFFVYDEVIYFAMTHDERRNEVYKRAFAAHVDGKVVLDIGTGRDAILARLCIEAGARKVYAFEIMEASFHAATETVARLGLADRILVMHADSRQATLPEAVDVCVSEIVGAIGGSEGAGLIIDDAWRFMKPGGVMIPSRSVTRVAALSLPEAFLAEPRFSTLSGHYVQRIFDQVGYRFDLRLSLRHAGYEHLASEVGVFEDLDYTRPAQAESRHDIDLAVTRDAPVCGFLVWLTLDTMPGATLDILEHEHCWLPVWLPVWDPPLPLREGDRIVAEVRRSLWHNGLNPDYALAGEVRRAGEVLHSFEYRAHHADRDYRASPLYQRLFDGDRVPVHDAVADLSPAGVQRHLSLTLPAWMLPREVVLLYAMPLTPNGKLDRTRLPDPRPVAALPSAATTPATRTETLIAQAWQQVLGLTSISRHANFFDLGGHSLKMIKVHSLLADGLARPELQLMDLFQHPTVAALACWLDGGAAPAAAAPDAQRQQAGRDRLRQLAARRAPGAR